MFKWLLNLFKRSCNRQSKEGDRITLKLRTKEGLFAFKDVVKLFVTFDSCPIRSYSIWEKDGEYVFIEYDLKSSISRFEQFNTLNKLHRWVASPFHFNERTIYIFDECVKPLLDFVESIENIPTQYIKSEEEKKKDKIIEKLEVELKMLREKEIKE